MACNFYDITISALDLADATGNSDPLLDNVVFVDYNDCDGINQDKQYTISGIYVDDICVTGTSTPTIYYWKNNLASISSNSTAVIQGVCTVEVTPTPTPTNTPTNTKTPTPTPTNTKTPTPTPTNTPTQTKTPTNTPTQTQTPSSPPIICGLGLTTGTYYYTNCCNIFIQGSQVGLEVSFDYTKPFGGITKLDTRTTIICLTPTPTPTTTVTPTNTVTTSQTPTNTLTPTPSITPSITPSNTPVTRLKNECDVITLFDMGISCNVIQSPTESNPLGGILSINVTGGTAPYSFFWEGGQRSQTLFGVPAGSYEVVVTDYKWPDGKPDGISDYTATTICELVGPLPSLTPTTTPTPTPTSPVQCVDLCLIAIAPIGVPNLGPIQFVCNGTQNGRFKWTGGGYDIIWNVDKSRWEIYITGTTTPLSLGGGILASTTINLIPDSAWQVLGGTEQYSITMTRGNCPTVIPLQISIDEANSTCQGTTNCNGKISILAENGYPPYTYSINGGITSGVNNTFTNLCPNSYTVVVTDSQNNTQNSSVTIGYDSVPVTYQLSLANTNVATPITVPNVSQTVTQLMTLVVNPILPVGVSITFNLLATDSITVNGPGVGTSSTIWNVTKNSVPVTTIIGPTTLVSQGTRPFCSPNTQITTSIDYSSTITITNGDVIIVTATTVDTITNGQVGSQTNCTTNIVNVVSAVISTPVISGNNCSSVIGSSRQVQTNDFTYVPNEVVIPTMCFEYYSLSYPSLPPSFLCDIPAESTLFNGKNYWELGNCNYVTQCDYFLPIGFVFWDNVTSLWYFSYTLGDTSSNATYGVLNNPNSYPVQIVGLYEWEDVGPRGTCAPYMINSQIGPCGDRTPIPSEITGYGIWGAINSTYPPMDVTVWYSIQTTLDNTQPYPIGLTWTQLNIPLTIPQCNDDVFFGNFNLTYGQYLYYQVRNVSGTIIYQSSDGDVGTGQQPCISSLRPSLYTNYFAYDSPEKRNKKFKLINPSTFVSAPS
jgi:hypothetical protein